MQLNTNIYIGISKLSLTKPAKAVSL